MLESFYNELWPRRYLDCWSSRRADIIYIVQFFVITIGSIRRLLCIVRKFLISSKGHHISLFFIVTYIKQEMSKSYHSQSSGNLRDDGNFTAAGKGQVCIPTADKNAQFRKLKAISSNQVCFDCPATRPTWASVTYGKCVWISKPTKQNVGFLSAP
jgi:hypothetical protein